MSKAHSFTITETTASDMARAFLGFQFRQPLVAVTYLVMLAFSIYIGFALQSVWYALSYAVLAFVVLPWSRYHNIRKRFKMIFPVGSSIAATLGAKELAIVMPKATSKIAYSVFKNVTEQGNFLVLRQKASKVCIILPRELFTDAGLDKLKANINSAK